MEIRKICIIKFIEFLFIVLFRRFGVEMLILINKVIRINIICNDFSVFIYILYSVVYIKLCIV